MRAIALILLLLAGCGDDTTVAVGADMTILITNLCERDGTCCCGPPTVPKTCIAFAGVGQPCAAGATCNLDLESGGYCYCDATSGTWACHFPFAPYPPLDMTAKD
jgi:hypothetical protein